MRPRRLPTECLRHAHHPRKPCSNPCRCSYLSKECDPIWNLASGIQAFAGAEEGFVKANDRL
eukprot:scaffold318_cov269-Pinguiococcus_pyrenoidosus.AAC.4